MYNKIMNNKLLVCSIFAMIVLATSCEKDIPNYMNFASYNYTSRDENGGSWTHILPTASDITIDAPSAPNSAEYLAELADMKAAMQQVTGEQKKAIEYWTNNPIVRWNEIAVELISKYNLIPGPSEDGTYTLPNANNPDGPPPFPFA